MKTLGLFQSKWTLQDTRSIHDSIHILKMEFIAYCLYLHFIINIWNIKIIYNLGKKTVLYLIWNCINGFVGM